MFECLGVWNNQGILLKYRDLNAKYIVLPVFFSHPFGSSIVGSSAKILRTATFFIVCHLRVCNLSPVLSKRCNVLIMPDFSRIMCQGCGRIVGDVSLTGISSSFLSSVVLSLFLCLSVSSTYPPLFSFSVGCIQHCMHPMWS